MKRNGLLLLSAVLMMACNLFSLVGHCFPVMPSMRFSQDREKSFFTGSSFICGWMIVFYLLFSGIKLSDLIIDDPSESTCRPVHAQSDFDKISELPIATFDRVQNRRYH